jgi:hypothetical protein
MLMMEFSNGKKSGVKIKENYLSNFDLLLQFKENLSKYHGK